VGPPIIFPISVSSVLLTFQHPEPENIPIIRSSPARFIITSIFPIVATQFRAGQPFSAKIRPRSQPRA
jgi:hypothetical protein